MLTASVPSAAAPTPTTSVSLQAIPQGNVFLFQDAADGHATTGSLSKDVALDFGAASASATAIADFGALRLDAATSASAVGDPIRGAGSTSAAVIMEGAWTDYISVPPKLPLLRPGDPVQVAASLTLAGVSVSPPTIVHNGNVFGYALYQAATLVTQSTETLSALVVCVATSDLGDCSTIVPPIAPPPLVPFEHEEAATVNLIVGETYTLTTRLSITANAAATGFLPDGSAGISLTADASNSAHTYLQPLGDFTIVSASGHDYSLPGPVVALDSFQCDGTKATKGELCSGTAPANVGAACQREEDCGGVADATAFCVPNKLPNDLRVTLADRFEAKDYDVKKPVGLCAPADVNASGIHDAADRLRAYQITQVRKSCLAGAPANAGRACASEEECGGAKKTTAFCATTPKLTPHTNLPIESPFGSLHVDVVAADRLLVPSATSVTGPVAPPDPSKVSVDHFKCYKVKLSRGAPKFRPMLGVSVSGGPARLFDVKKPARLCTPVDANAGGIAHPATLLTCFEVVPQKGQPKNVPIKGIFVNDRFGPEQADAVTLGDLCVPSTMAGGAGG